MSGFFWKTTAGSAGLGVVDSCRPIWTETPYSAPSFLPRLLRSFLLWTPARVSIWNCSLWLTDKSMNSLLWFMGTVTVGTSLPPQVRIPIFCCIYILSTPVSRDITQMWYAPNFPGMPFSTLYALGNVSWLVLAGLVSFWAPVVHGISLYLILGGLSL